MNPGSVVRQSRASAPDQTGLYVRSRPGPTPLTALLCDGLVCDGFIYKYLWDDLAERLSVAHWHYRGHGRSAQPHDPHQIDVVHHAADLDAVRRHLGDPPVILVGHSFGTQVALEAYRLRPERVVGLVFLCGSFGRVTYTFKNSELLANVLPNLIRFVTRHGRLARGLWARVPPGLALRVARMTGDVDSARVNVEDIAPYFDHALHVDFELFLKMLANAGEHSAQDLLPAVRVPTLVVAGEHDSFTPPQVSQAMAESIPGAELEIVPGASHLAPLEHRDLLKARFFRFVDERVMPGAGLTAMP
jgi:pimeloyl-ACP methyl ester carboxylesterase